MLVGTFAVSWGGGGQTPLLLLGSKLSKRKKCLMDIIEYLFLTGSI